MNRTTSIRPEFVEYIPQRLEPGVLYVSRRYSTATHLCCCGCSREVVTPLNAAKWRLLERDGVVSLSPSIGNWSFPCKSHYWIRANAITWAGSMSPRTIAAVKERDRLDAERLASQKPARLPALHRLSAVWEGFRTTVRGWLGW